MSMSRPAVNSRLYRCRLRPRDNEAAPPYELERDGLTTYRLKYPNPHFDVSRNEITIKTSDALESNRLPGIRVTVDDNGVKRRATPIAFDEDDDTKERWLEEIGELVAAVMFGKKVDNHALPFKLVDFPRNMQFYLLERRRSDRSSRPRTDVQLQVHSGLIFESPQEFVRHCMWLMDGMPRGACLCRYCGFLEGTRRTPAPQTPITEELHELAGLPIKATKTSRARTSR